MGFRQGGYMTVWSVEPGRSGNTTKVRLSSSRKNKQSGEYEQDFSGFCTFIGKAHNMANKLTEKDRIKIIECDVSNSYNKETKTEYIYYKVFEFEMADGVNGNTAPEQKPAEKAGKKTASKRAAIADEGEVAEDNLPF